MSTVKADTLSTLDGAQSISTDRVAKATAKAWVNFNGQNTPAIRASYNVSSLTDVGVGDWRINFTTAMPDVNYALAGSASVDATSKDAVSVIEYLAANARITVGLSNSTPRDASYVTAVVFR